MDKTEVRIWQKTFVKAIPDKRFAPTIYKNSQNSVISGTT